MIRLLLLQGANMEYLGRRQPEIYGTTTLEELHTRLAAEAAKRDIALETFTTNIEGEAITRIYAADRQGMDGLLFNPAGFLHAGYALRDCLMGIRMPAIEIHISNIDRRGFHSVTASAAVGMVMGFGHGSYVLAMDAMLRRLNGGGGPGRA